MHGDSFSACWKDLSDMNQTSSQVPEIRSDIAYIINIVLRSSKSKVYLLLRS